jgi:hypothetical protein
MRVVLIYSIAIGYMEGPGEMGTGICLHLLFCEVSYSKQNILCFKIQHIHMKHLLRDILLSLQLKLEFRQKENGWGMGFRKKVG